MREDGRSSVHRLVQEGRDRVAASDPGLNRLRAAVGVVVAVGTTLGVEWVLARLTGVGSRNAFTAMLFGAVVAITGSMGLSSGPSRQKVLTAVASVVALGAGVVLGAAVFRDTGLLLGVFVVVLFAAVYVRRFGQPFFVAGMMAWTGYFFTSLLGASFDRVPWLILSATVAVVWVLLLSLTVLKENPECTLRRTLRALIGRAAALAAAAAAVLHRDGDRARRRLRKRHQQVGESALLIEGQLGDAPALPGGWSAAGLRRDLVDVQLALDEIALTALLLAQADGGSQLLRPGSDALAHLAAGRLEAAIRLADGLDARLPADSGVKVRHTVRRLVAAVHGYAESAGRWQACLAGNAAGQAASEDITPSVTLMMGQLPSSALVAGDVPAHGVWWGPLARLPLTTRQAIQVALACGVAIAAGRALDPQRYYWAVLAAFLVFTGTATRAETFLRGASRVLGTAAGLGAAILVANLTAGHTGAAFAVILASMFLAYYLRQLNYIFIFFLSIMVAQLYTVLHEFTGRLLVLRLEETGIGAAVGILVALAVLPLDPRDADRAAARRFYAALHDLLEAAADGLDTVHLDAEHRSPAQDLDGLARAVDSHFYQLEQVVKPLTTPPARRSDTHSLRQQLDLLDFAASAARGLARAVRSAPAGGMSPLAAACRALARTAELLADQEGPHRPLPEAAASLREAEAALDSAYDHSQQGAGSDVAGVHQAITRLLHALRRLAVGSHAALASFPS